MVSPLLLSLKKQKNLHASSVKIESPAKINLYLNILGKYSSGFHRIESIFERISLCDVITITLCKDQGVTIKCNDRSLEAVDNLCVKAALLILKKSKRRIGCHIDLNKKIPVGAGLGGGSSNAASTLIGLNLLLGLKLKKEELYKMGKKLGSDVNFFLTETSYALVGGRGEKVAPFKAKSLKHLVIWPGVFLSTAKVYKAARAKLTKNLSNANILAYALKKGDQRLAKSLNFNVLAKSALSQSKKLQRIKSFLSKHDIDARVTGSGSALFTFGDNHRAGRIKKLLPRNCTLFKVNTL